MPGSTFHDQPPTCDACDGPGQFLGRLGDLDHWSCRDCGMQFNTPADDEPDTSDPWDGTDDW